MDPSIAVRLDPRLAARLAEKKARLDVLRPLPPAVVQRLADDMRVLLTYHSNAIEGNTLSLYELIIRAFVGPSSRAACPGGRTGLMQGPTGQGSAVGFDSRTRHGAAPSPHRSRR
jgi:hypothetical protein